MHKDNHSVIEGPDIAVFLSLGSNLGDKKSNLNEAIEKIRIAGIQVLKVSSCYQSTPIGFESENTFINIIIEVKTKLSPRSLLERLKKIEVQMGRIQRKSISERYSDRLIDIDIIDYGNLAYKDEMLEIPHKEMSRRNFVLLPLSEIHPEYFHPLLKMTITDLLFYSTDKTELLII